MALAKHNVVIQIKTPVNPTDKSHKHHQEKSKYSSVVSLLKNTHTPLVWVSGTSLVWVSEIPLVWVSGTSLVWVSEIPLVWVSGTPLVWVSGIPLVWVRGVCAGNFAAVFGPFFAL
jgi:hypothetical protein